MYVRCPQSFDGGILSDRRMTASVTWTPLTSGDQIFDEGRTQNIGPFQRLLHPSPPVSQLHPHRYPVPQCLNFDPGGVGGKGNGGVREVGGGSYVAGESARVPLNYVPLSSKVPLSLYFYR